VVPAVALTAYARPEDRDRALAAGFQVHLSKPVEPRALLEAVARLAAGGSRDGGDLRGPSAPTSSGATC
jgi:CheY-like chemotaxis protein